MQLRTDVNSLNSCLYSNSSRKHTKYSANIAMGLYREKYPVSKRFRYAWKQVSNGKKLSFLRHSLPWQQNEQTQLPRKKSLIDILNISKYHFLQTSWSKDINFLMLSIKQDCQFFFLSYCMESQSIFRSFHQKSYRLSVDIMDFRVPQ